MSRPGPKSERWPRHAPSDDVERYQLVYGIAFRAAYKLLKSETRAEDVAQDVWIDTEKFLVRYRQGHGDELRNFEHWVARVATNRAIKVYQSKWQRVLRDDSPSDDLPTVSEGDARRPDELAAVRQIGQHLRAAMTELSHPLSQAFSLYCAGYTHREIAERLDTPIGTIKVRIHRARRRLARLLEDSELAP